MDPIWTDPPVAQIERRRIPGHVSRGRGKGPPFAFGTVFVLAGVGLAGVAFGVIPVSSQLPKGGELFAMRWIAVGFAAAGVYLLSWTSRSRWRQRRASEIAREGNAWRADHPWDPIGRLHGDGARALRRNAMAMTLLASLLVPLHVAFVTEMLPRAGPHSHGFWIPVIVLGIFDLVLLLGVGELALRGLRWLRFGRLRLECGTIPLRLGEAIRLELVAPAMLSPGQEVTGHLRCVAETFLHRRRGSQIHIEQVSYALHDETATSHVGDHGRASFEFRLPGTEEALGNDLVSDPPRYWELEVQAKRPGLDLSECFLLPVYGDR